MRLNKYRYIAPFDVRQSGFTGTAINGVTRSGTNEFEGSVYASTRSNKKEFVGTKAGQIRIIPATFEEKYWELDSGQLLKQIVFLETLKQLIIQVPTTWTSTGSPQPSAQISAPTFQQMQDLSHSCKIN
jgi:hypothetical protein